MATSAPVIGIDLGTTFSCVGIYNNGKAEIIPNKNGQRLTPSMVYYHPNSLEVSVGVAAYDLGKKCLPNLLFDIKRIIGRKFDDIYVQKLRDSSQITFTIIRGDEDGASVELTHDGVKVTKSPEQISSEILRYLKESAEKYLREKVFEAVVTVPAYFNNAQRKATKAAAEYAGLKLLKLVTEPVAATIYYCIDKIETTATLLVFDFGGGTLDVSIISVNNQKFVVKAVEGDTLGGRDIDELMYNHFNQQLVHKYKNIQLPRWIPRRLKESCIQLKEMMSTELTYEITIECVTGGNDDGFCLSITRGKFNDMISAKLKRALELVKISLLENGLKIPDIDKVILVGGSSQIAKLNEMLQSYFGKTEIKTDLSPDEAVALGAGIQAALIKEQHKELEKVKITEITPLSLGLGIKGDLMKFFVRKGTPLPAKVTNTLRTVTNDQVSSLFEIFEGERTNCKFNNELGSFTISGLPKGRAGDVHFEATFNLNEDGILKVEATEKSTVKNNKLFVTMGEFRLCENKIGRTVVMAMKNKEEDRLFENFIIYRNEAEEHIEHILYELHKITSDQDKQLVEKRCVEFMKFSKNADFKRIDLLKDQFTKLKTELTSTLAQYKLLNYNQKFRFI